MLIHQAVHRILNVNCSSFSSCQIISWHRCNVALDYLPVWGFLLSQTKQEIKTDIADRQLPGCPDSQSLLIWRRILLHLCFSYLGQYRANNLCWSESWCLAESTIIGKLFIFHVHLVPQPLPWTYFRVYLQKSRKNLLFRTFFSNEKKILCKPFNI